jgi:hypothetical protein
MSTRPAATRARHRADLLGALGGGSDDGVPGEGSAGGGSGVGVGAGSVGLSLPTGGGAGGGSARLDDALG